MKVAIASSGLGHVARGIETWARDLAYALVGLDVDATLFAGAQLPGSITSASGSSTTRQPATRQLKIVVIRCLKRNDRIAGILTRIAPGFLWRWGLKNPYGWEQLSFWLHLWPILRREQFDIMHVQDPMLAFWCRECRRLGMLKTREILAHGTEESAVFLSQFDYVQHLAPWHLEQAVSKLNVEMENRSPENQTADTSTMRTLNDTDQKRERTGKTQHLIFTTQVSNEKTIENRNDDSSSGFKFQVSGFHRHWFSIPNFVDADVFRPVKDSHEKAAIRARMGLPVDAFVVGTVAAVKQTHKRIDHLIREFSMVSSSGLQPFLLIAGARTDESGELIRLANELIPGRVRIALDLQRDSMPEFYRAMDVFVLPSLFEMMPIALIEAMASGLPVIVNRHPVLEWISGQAGACVDMASEGELTGALLLCGAAEMTLQRGQVARQRVLDMFSKDAVVKEITGMYKEVMMQ